MKIEDINDEWASDCHIDRNNITLESLRTPNLHQKYLNLMMQCKQRLIKYRSDYNEMKEVRARYYSGEMTSEECKEYGWSQYQGLKPLKSAMEGKLETDSELSKIKLKLDYMETMHYQLESILNQIRGRDWTIKNHIEWSKFQAGN